METPSSTRRVTRSLAWASSNNSNNIPVSRKIDDSISKERNNGCALMDITNDSPIVGLANSGNLDTPLSSVAKHGGSRMKKTPGSGEALLRGQVKNLLHKVEEEAVLSKISLESRPFLQLMNSPTVLGAPTPANTPQIPNLSVGDSVLVTPSTIVQEQLIPQVLNHMFEGKKNGEESESEKSVITRSLLLDFSEKSEISDESECFSELSYQEVVQGGDEDASIWSMQVNASTPEEDYDDDNVEDEIAEDEDDGDYYEEEEEEGYGEDDGGSVLDELCEGLNNISVKERVAPKFEGKHTIFLYNSDDEIVKEEEVENSVASDVLHLKGIPTPKGKHLRFTEEEEDE
ncbi:unnamed protein product [Lupinus luteus]|uniref:Chalcone-flavanone isomerase family protein n=1 Tax=Lupinus luteus TaxID=3873 RepID=A0AAV1WQ53_LUPLU